MRYHDLIEAARPSIRAYHGTVHDFARFQLKAVGKGEGFQVYGYGLYFAENFDVAKHYADKLGEKLRPDDPEAKIIYEVALAVDPTTMLDYDKRLTEQTDYVKKALGERLYRDEPRINGKSFWNSFPDVSPTLRVIARNVFMDAHGDLDQFDQLMRHRTEHSTDQSKAWTEQIIAYVRNSHRTVESHIKPGQGQHMLDDLRNEFGSPKAASQWLRSVGIPGVIYLDQDSRYEFGDDAPVTHNYVIFDARKVRVVRKIPVQPVG